MGRVAKYKKIKAVDPYSKKNGGRVDLSKVGIWGLGSNGRKVKKRSRRSEQLRASRNAKGRDIDEGGFDLPPSSRKDDFDLSDLTSVKKEKMVNPLKDDKASKNQDLFAADKVQVNGNVATIPKSDHDERKAARILNVKSQVQKEVDKKEAKKHARMAGESKNAYNKRTRAETRQIIKQTTVTQNVEKRQKKKEFLNNKKKKKRGDSASIVMDDDDDFERNDCRGPDTLITGERAIAMVDEVKFGEQAERPPVFKHIPRGAKKQSVGSKTKSKQTKGMSEEEVEAENRSMELMRRKIQAQYNAVKMKRRKAGDFHL